MLILLLAVLSLSTFEPTLRSYHYQDQDLVTISSFIARQAHRERGEEYEGGGEACGGEEWCGHRD